MRTRLPGSAADEERAGSASSAGSGSGSSPPDAGRALSGDSRPSSRGSSSHNHHNHNRSQHETTATANTSSNIAAKIRPPTTLLPVPPASSQEVERRKSIEKRPSVPRSRASNHNESWKLAESRHGHVEKTRFADSAVITVTAKEAAASGKMSDTRQSARRPRLRNPWACSPLTVLTTLVAIVCLSTILHSYVSRQLDAKGCRMSYMRPSFAKLSDFDSEHTRFASKYSTYLYREGLIDEDTKVKGVPVLFIPGNAGSYKQVRPIAAEAATYFHDIVQHDTAAINAGVRNLDFFTVDFNEDITAFHGQTMLDQAEYLNEAVAYILSLYHDPRRSKRDPDLPDPTSVIILGHSMGGIVARTMLIMPNYQSNSINTIITMSAPHARPPVSFDAEIVKTYDDINSYWRQAYSQKWANNNPLWHVTLISIVGGGLDSVVPSDYASLESLVPDTHGFTVFTTSVPTVWTSMDHQAILWCDQFRKVVVRSLYEVVDVYRPAQTKPRAERMRVFKKWYLTGMEDIAEKSLTQKEPTTLLTLDDGSNSIIPQGDRLTIRRFGESGKPRAHLLPIPPQGTPGGTRFTLLTDQKLDKLGDSGKLEIMFCSVFPLHPGHGQSGNLFAINMDLSGDNSGSTRLACKNAAADNIPLPASTRTTKNPFYLDGEREIQPFSYLQYDLEDIQDHQFVAVVDKAVDPTPGWVVAEFSDNAQSHRVRSVGLRRLLAFGLSMKLPATRPMVSEISIPVLQSSLLAYKLDMGSQVCGDEAELFTPLLRQYMSNPYESKYFVNVKHVDVNLHGMSPFMPPSLRQNPAQEGLSLQFWTDPTCNSSIKISLSVDIPGSLGKLYMRYRTAFAAFPLLVVALVLRKQFRIYDESGIFIPFSESLDLCLRQSLPLILAALTCLSVSLAEESSAPQPSPGFWSGWSGNVSDSQIDFTKNDLLVGAQDTFFWFMVPLIGLICVGVCVILNYTTLALTHALSLVYGLLTARPGWVRNDDKRRAISPAFQASTPRRRLLTTAVLLFFVSTVIPYQFAYLVACLVQMATTARALRFAREARSISNQNFYNYVHSILILMMWILPINLPILVVWVHNLAVHWLTPFSSHHNVLSIMPFIFLVETLTTGKMVPRVTSRLHHLTSIFFFCIAVYAAVYGMTYAYMLHYLVNFVAAWLVAIHSSTSSWTLTSLRAVLDPEAEESDRKQGKTG